MIESAYRVHGGEDLVCAAAERVLQLLDELMARHRAVPIGVQPVEQRQQLQHVRVVQRGEATRLQRARHRLAGRADAGATAQCRACVLT
jgi:hypothetical protein